MAARPRYPLALAAILCTCALAVAEDSARDMRDQALASLRTLRDQATDPPVLSHLRNAVTFLERSLDQFTDADHILDPPQAIDNVRQSIDSCTVAAKEALRAGNRALADALKVEAARLAACARRLASVLLGEAQGAVGRIDSASQAANAAGLQEAQDEIARGDEQLQQQDASFNRYNFDYRRYDNAVNRFKASWIAAQRSDSFLLRLLSAEASPSLFSPNGDGRRDTCVLTAQFEAYAPAAGTRVRSEWTLRSGGAVVRTVRMEQEIPAGAGVVSFQSQIAWDGLNDAGQPAADGPYDWTFTAVLLAPNTAENPLDGSLTGSVALDSTAPVLGAATPGENASVADRRPAIGLPWSDALSGIDLASASIIVEGIVRTTQATRTASGISFTPTDPFPDGQVDVVVTVRDLAETESSRAWSFDIVSAIGQVDPAGGTLGVTDPDSPVVGASVQVPAGALAGPATITISAATDPPATGEVVAPSGNVVDIVSSVSTFSQDILLVIPYEQEMVDAAGIDERSLEVFFYDGSAWVSIPVVARDTEADTLTVAVRHLSMFLVGYRRASAATSTIAVDATRLMADGQDQAAVTVIPRDAAGVPLGPYRLVEVRFRQEIGTPPGPPPPGGSISSVSNAGDEFYRATLTSGTTIQTVTLEAIADGVLFTQTATVSYEAEAAQLVVIAPAQATAGGPVPLTIRAVDAKGARVRAYRGTVRLDSSDPQASFNDSTIALGAADAGERTVPNIGSFLLAGTHRIQAVDTSRPAIAGESDDVVVSPGAASALRKVFGDFQSGDAGTWLVDPLRAQIEDAYGNAIPGQALVFEALTGAGTLSTTYQGTPADTLTVTTDALGEAGVFVRLDTTAGPNEVEVRFPGVDPVRFTLSGTGLVVPDVVSIAAVTPVAVGNESEVTVTLTSAGAGVPGKLGQLSVASDRAGDVLGDLLDNGDGTYTTSLRSNVAGVSRATATYDDGTTVLVSGEAVVGFQAPNRLTLEGPSPVPKGEPAKLTIRLFVDQTPVPGMALQLSIVSARAEDTFGDIQEEGAGAYSVDVTSTLAGVADLQAFFDDPTTVPPNDLSSNVLSVVFQEAVQGPPPPRVIESDPADGEGGVPLNKVVSVTFDRSMDTGGLSSSAFAIFGGQEVSFGFLGWRRVAWNAYNQANGETWPACGDVDGDGRDEIVLGLGTYPAGGGWLQVLDDEGGNYASLRWLRLPWTAYNNADGEVRPACGDIDGDGKDEIVVGLGPFPQAGGYLHVWDDLSTGFAARGWIRMTGSAYNATNGECWPACGDVDGDGRDEIAAGRGTFPANGGLTVVFDDALSTPPHKELAWTRLGWSNYNATDGQVHPSVGDVDGDGRAELVLGTGPYPSNGGWMQVRDDASLGYAPLKWLRVDWAPYNAANGTTYPACGDVDGDRRAEVIAGLGSYPANGGWLRILDGAETSYRKLGWVRVAFAAYNPVDGQTRPAAGNLRGDRVEEFVVGLGPFATNGGWAEVLNGRGNVAGRVCFHDDEEGRTVAKFAPDLQFEPNETYRIEVRDVAGRDGLMMDQVASTPVKDPFLASFSTDVEDHYLPEVLETTPANGARDVSLLPEVRVRFDERMDGTLAWANLVYLRDMGAPSSTYTGTVAMEEDGAVVVLRGPYRSSAGTTVTEFSGNRNLEVVVSGQVKDLAGNAMVLEYTSGFRTLNPLVMQATIQYPSGLATRLAAGVTIVGGTAQAGYDVELSINEGTSAELRLRTRADKDGRWMQPVNFLAGSHTLRARGVAWNGELSAPSSLVTISVVSNLPSIVVTRPANGERINVPWFRMRVEARNSSTINLGSMQVYVDTMFSPIPRDAGTPRLESISGGMSGGFPFWEANVVGLPDGRHTLIAAVPMVGMPTATVAITVDNTSPAVTAVLDPAADAEGVLRTFPFRVVFKADDVGSGLNVSSLELKANGEDIHCEVVHGQGLDPAGGRPEDPSIPQSLRAIWTPTIEELAALLQKTQTNRVRACIGIRDLVGNWNEVCVEFTIDYSGASEDDPFPGVPRLPAAWVLRRAPDSSEFAQGLTSRGTTSDPVVQLVDALRGMAPVAGIPIRWTAPRGYGVVARHPTLSTVTNAQGRAGVRFFNGDSPGECELTATAEEPNGIPAVTFLRSGYSPILQLIHSPLEEDQEPLLVREAFGIFRPRGLTGIGLISLWVFRAMDPVKNEPLVDAEVFFTLVMPDDQTGEWLEARDAAYHLPSAQLTDSQGYAEFDLEGRLPGAYKVEARLTEFPGADPYREPDGVITIAATRPIELRFDAGGTARLAGLSSIIISGNGQIGVGGSELPRPIELDLPGFATQLASASASAGWTFMGGTVEITVAEGPPPGTTWNAPAPQFAPTGLLRLDGGAASANELVLPLNTQSPIARVFFTPSFTSTHVIGMQMRGQFVAASGGPVQTAFIRREAIAVGPPNTNMQRISYQQQADHVLVVDSAGAPIPETDRNGEPRRYHATHVLPVPLRKSVSQLAPRQMQTEFWIEVDTIESGPVLQASVEVVAPDGESVSSVSPVAPSSRSLTLTRVSPSHGGVTYRSRPLVFSIDFGIGALPELPPEWPLPIGGERGVAVGEQRPTLGARLKTSIQGVVVGQNAAITCELAHPVVRALPDVDAYLNYLAWYYGNVSPLGRYLSLGVSAGLEDPDIDRDFQTAEEWVVSRRALIRQAAEDNSIPPLALETLLLTNMRMINNGDVGAELEALYRVRLGETYPRGDTAGLSQTPTWVVKYCAKDPHGIPGLVPGGTAVTDRQAFDWRFQEDASVRIAAAHIHVYQREYARRVPTETAGLEYLSNTTPHEITFEEYKAISLLAVNADQWHFHLESQYPMQSGNDVIDDPKQLFARGARYGYKQLVATRGNEDGLLEMPMVIVEETYIHLLPFPWFIKPDIYLNPFPKK